VFRRLPVRLGLRHLPPARLRETEQALPLVFSGSDTDPTLLLQQPQRLRQCRAIHTKARAQPFLIGLSGRRKRSEQTELRNFESCVVQPRS
jgi:hypothetical protein